MVSALGAWTMGAFGSAVGGAVVAFYIGDQETKDSILFVVPFLVIGVIGVFTILSDRSTTTDFNRVACEVTRNARVD